MGHRNGVHKYKSYFQAEWDYIWIYPLVNDYPAHFLVNIAWIGFVGYRSNSGHANPQ